mgnify:FL=1
MLSFNEKVQEDTGMRIIDLLPKKVKRMIYRHQHQDKYKAALLMMKALRKDPDVIKRGLSKQKIQDIAADHFGLDHKEFTRVLNRKTRYERTMTEPYRLKDAEYFSSNNFINEAAKVSATDMEAVIVVAYNGGYENAKDTFGLKKETYDLGKDIAAGIVDDIRSKTKASENSMIHFGSGSGQLNPKWLGSNGTPKTDLYSTDGINISLKQKGGSQVMSGYKEETISTFHAAIASMGSDAPKEINKLMKDLDPVLRKITVPGNINTIITSIKTKTLPKGVKAKVGSSKRELDIKFNKKEYEAKQNEIIDWKASMKELNPVFRKFFEDNQEFRKFFVYEAATGDFKFAPDKYANSNWMVEFDPANGTNNNVVQLSLGKNKPAPFIDKLAKKVVVRISPKTPTGSKVSASGTSATVGSFRLTVAESKETFSEMLIQEEAKFNSELLTEGTISEAKLFQKLKGWLSNLYNKVMNKVKKLIKMGYEAVMAFFEFEVDSVDTKGLQMFGFK